MPDAAEEAADRIYGVPLEDFVRERDAAAKALRPDDRDGAASVSALRKPAAHAWAVNQAIRRAPELRDELLAAGAELREAQEAAIAGGGHIDLRAATARERAAVDALLEAAREERPSGRPLSATAVDRLRRTLHAAAGDEEVREALAAARLVGDAEGGGAWPFATGAATTTAPRAPRRRAGPKSGGGPRASKAAGDDTTRAEEAERRRAEEAEAARRREVEARLEDARRERGAREREHARADREAQRSAERLERALADAEEARERADAARAALEGARAALDHARDDVARLEEQR